MLSTSFFAYQLLLPPEIVKYAKSLLAATISASNFYFWTELGYFDPPAAMKPLLHTWSLGIEEQFYIFFPMVFVFIYRHFQGKWRVLISTLTAVCFGVGVMATWIDQDSAFYLPHSRAWEFLIGVLVAIEIFPKIRKPILREGTSLLGAGLVAYAIGRYSVVTPFPGLAAILPCLGTALVIAANGSGSTLVGRILSLKPFVFVGLISYSLYLWHWPVMVFWKNSIVLASIRSGKLAAYLSIGISLILATASWKYIEGPFRSGKKLSRSIVFKMVFSGATLAFCLGILAVMLNGLPQRFPARAARLAAYLDHNSDELNSRGKSCFLTTKLKFTDFNPKECLDRMEEMKNYLLLGDSHAAHLWYGISNALPKVNLMQATVAGCRPYLDLAKVRTARCVDLMTYIFAHYLNRKSIDKVLLSAQWFEFELSELSRTLDWIVGQGIPVVLFGPIPEYDTALPRLLVRSLIENDGGKLVNDHRLLKQKLLDNKLRQLAADKKVQYISMYDTVCEDNRCEVLVTDDIPLQFDYGHLTKEGSAFLMQRLNHRGLLF
jgi:peptidoglycan/LPS O-acetylase OafA/YrhL